MTDEDAIEQATLIIAHAKDWTAEQRREDGAGVRMIYLSGPIAGRTAKQTQDAFGRAADLVNSWPDCRAVNPLTLSPAEHPNEDCPDAGYRPGQGAVGHTSSCCFMRADLQALLGCDEILMLDGWQASRGANVEKTVAEAIGLPVHYAESLTGVRA